MFRISLASAPLLLACGPLAPSLTTTETTTSAATDSAPTTTTPTITPDASTPGPVQCDTFAQNCPPGQKCTSWADDGGDTWNATRCVDITGDDAPTEPCTAVDGGTSGIDSCALGAMCWSVDETGHGVCVGLCSGTPEAPICPPFHYCASSYPLNFCFVGCDPLLQDCGEDELCIPSNGSFQCAIDASGDEGQTNDPCGFANACDAGLVCLDTPSASAACEQRSTGCCQPFCKFPDAPCPNPDQQCVQWFDPMMPIPEGYENVGVCAIPD
jgi:hypothetical protein